MNDPKKLNGWTVQMLMGLKDAFQNAATDKDVDVVILTGAGTYYCAGVNLSAILKPMHPQKLHDLIYVSVYFFNCVDSLLRPSVLCRVRTRQCSIPSWISLSHLSPPSTVPRSGRLSQPLPSATLSSWQKVGVSIRPLATAPPLPLRAPSTSSPVTSSMSFTMHALFPWFGPGDSY